MDKDALKRDRIGTETMDIPGVGVITVRGLNRFIARKVTEAKGVAQDRLIIKYGVTDPPGLTDADIDDWMNAAEAGEIEAVTERIAQLSGIGEGAAKERYKSAGDGSESGV